MAREAGLLPSTNDQLLTTNGAGHKRFCTSCFILAHRPCRHEGSSVPKPHADHDFGTLAELVGALLSVTGVSRRFAAPIFAVAAVLILAFAGRFRAVEAFDLLLLMLAAIAGAIVERHAVVGGVAMLPLTAALAGLLAFGPAAAALIAVTAILARHTAARTEATPAAAAIDAFVAVVTISMAALVHATSGGTVGTFDWPAQGLPVAAAAIVYAGMHTAWLHAIRPATERRPFNRIWWKHLPKQAALAVVAAGAAIGIAELLTRSAWHLIPVAVVPLALAYRAYAQQVLPAEVTRLQRAVVPSLDHGFCAVDRTGRVTVWDEPLAHLTGCGAQHALGKTLAEVPALKRTTVPAMLDEVLLDGGARSALRLDLTAVTGTRRLVRVRMLPVPDGVTVLWTDITEAADMEDTLRRREHRLAVAAEGASDGLWQLDVRTQELYISGRWRELLGLPACAETTAAEEWFDRVHVEDIQSLHDTLNAHLTGATSCFQHEHRIRHQDGNYRRVLARGLAVREAGRRTQIGGSLTDITYAALASEQMRTAALCDPLTGLRNRADFVHSLAARLEQLKQRRAGERFAVLYLDLDRFKIVNDSLGHFVGDELLVALSRRLESCLRPTDVLARLGGDEFAVLLNGLTAEGQANLVAMRIQDALKQPLSVAGREMFTSASIGIAFGSVKYESADEIMRDADTAMYQAKANGKARHELFDADMHARTRDRLGLENDLRHAVDNRAFQLHYQPIVSLSTGMCIGFEALIRWTRNGKPVSPATFIPIAEELGLIDTIGAWVLQEACHTFAGWKRRFDVGLECITVNASGRQLVQQNFMRLVEQAVSDSGIAPADLRIEITETALMDNPQEAADVLNQLREFGAKVYLDDFGTGYSSLTHLHRLPVDALKIDRSFVRSLLFPDRPAIVESVLALARTLNTSVVAEGVESDIQANELERLGCTHAQGYLFSMPLASDCVEQMLAANQPLGPKRGNPPVLEPDTYYASRPFEWPEHLLARIEAPESPAETNSLTEL